VVRALLAQLRPVEGVEEGALLGQDQARARALRFEAANTRAGAAS
jgi:hypothetical protein